MLHTIIDYLENSTEKYPSKPAFVYDTEMISYHDLSIQVQQIASWIKNNIHTKKKPILVLMHNTCSAVTAFLGIAYSNNIYVPVDSKLPLERLKTINEILNPVGIIYCDEYETRYEEVFTCKKAAFSELLDTTIKEDIYEDRIRILDTDPLYILFTSGSTGIPKGVVVSHRAVIDFTEEASENMHFSEKEIFLNQAPFYFDASVPDIYCTIRNGATLHIVDKQLFSFPIKLLDYISQKKINAIYWVPSALVAVANLRALGKREISSLKKVMFCGEVMPTKQLNQWRKELPEAIFVNYYGPSEATYACSYYIVDRTFSDEEALPIGRAAINTDLMIINENNELITDSDVIGELYIRGSGLAFGYYNNPAETKKHFIQNPLHSAYPESVYKTGDLVHYNYLGEICFDGRADYQIKHMGYRIELGEIEMVISSIQEIHQVACIYDEKKDAIIGFYEGELETNCIEEYLSDRIPFYMMPATLIKISPFPMNSNGKTDRKKLKELYEKGDQL